MNRKKTVLYCSILLCTSLFCATLEVEVGEIKPQRGGAVAMVVCDQKTLFPCKKSTAVVVAKRKAAFESEKFEFVLPNGVYAVAAIHDENGNELLDKNIFGMPTEGYALSGGAKRPDFEKSKFVVNGDTKIALKMGY